ncbi:MAG: universal stress protein [Candidatus Binatia bacterium]
MRFRRILVPVDFSEPSLAALRYATDLAHSLKASLDVVHVVEAVTYAPMVGSAVDLERLREEQGRAARARLDRLGATLGKRFGRRHTALRVGNAASSITDEAKRRRSDLIVMATKGRHGVGRLLLGSVTERVVRTAGCPVLIVPPRRSR